MKDSPGLLGGVPLEDLIEVGRLGAGSVGASLPGSDGPSEHLPLVLEKQKRPEKEAAGPLEANKDTTQCLRCYCHFHV